MSSPIDPIRKPPHLRRTRRTDVERAEEGGEAENAFLPVPAGPASAPPPEPVADTAAIFAAQLIGQDGQKRGLRAGPAVIDTAQSAYNQAEWSGSKDRRARKGRMTKTEI